MKIKNYTPHELCIMQLGKTIVRVPSSGVARVERDTFPRADVCGVPTQTVSLGDVTGLPEKEAGVFLVVSAMIREALLYRDDIGSPAGLVRDRAGLVIGCTSFDVNP